MNFERLYEIEMIIILKKNIVVDWRKFWGLVKFFKKKNENVYKFEFDIKWEIFWLYKWYVKIFFLI